MTRVPHSREPCATVTATLTAAMPFTRTPTRQPSLRLKARRLWRFCGVAALSVLLVLPVAAQVGDDTIVEAREALRAKNKARLVDLRDRVVAARHPLAAWVDYWELGSRLTDAQQPELDAFYARWRGSYVEDRLRNDWLLELGRRRDWVNFSRDHAQYRMNDDRDVACYVLLTRHLAGQDVKAPALAAWYAQRDQDEGCQLLASTLAEARLISPDDIWRELRLSVEANRLRAARAAAALLSASTAKAVADVLEQPARFLKHRELDPNRSRQELAVLALMRLARTDPEAAATALERDWATRLDDELAAAAWAHVGRQAAVRLQDRAYDYYLQAWTRQGKHGHAPVWSQDTLEWSVRAALRSSRPDRRRWAVVAQSIESMPAAEQQDPAWAYWQVQADLGRARNDAERQQARAQLEPMSQGLGFYAQLASQALDRPLTLPPPPPPLTPQEREQAAQDPGLQRGLRLAQIGLRDEGRREWNFTLRGMTDRQLLAAADMACQAEDWQLCINTSERTREQIDLRQRYPMPFRDEIARHAQARDLDPAFVFGLIRQETRFMPTLRSSAGASGLMQLMPATARWTARKIGLDFQPSQINEVDTNLRLGTAYLKLVLDDFAGSQAMAAAAYNAGPGRPRRWREGMALDAAVWAENVPFNETRNYVQKVLSNATLYSHLMGRPVAPLKTRLGATIGPRDPGSSSPDTNLP
jgi:soluble lytic murein transglycosylase